MSAAVRPPEAEGGELLPFPAPDAKRATGERRGRSGGDRDTPTGPLTHPSSTGSSRRRPEPARSTRAPLTTEQPARRRAPAPGSANGAGSVTPRPPGRPADPRLDDVDEWGRSEHFREVVRWLGSFYYDKWFRVEWQGLEHIPTTGGALLVANHAGAIPPDAPMLMHGIEKEFGRPVYGLADYWFRTLPVVGTLWSRAGGVAAHPDNAHRLLHDDRQLALVFPEGIKGPSKLARDRYQLRRFGRGGFVETAMRAGVPIVPIAIVGAEESMPILFKMPSVSRALGLPYMPVTANHLLLGPVMGSVTWLPAKFRFRALEEVRFEVEPGLERYPRSRVMEEADAIRERIQAAVHDMVQLRRSVWFG